MKKALAIILCAVMVMAVAVASTSAAGFDIRNALIDFGQPNYLVGDDYVLSAPQLDGVVSIDEYTFENTITKNDVAFVDNALENDLKEYVAHDEHYIYWAIVVTEANIASSEYGTDGQGAARTLQFQMNADDSGDGATSYCRLNLMVGLLANGETKASHDKRHPNGTTSPFVQVELEGGYEAKAFRDDTAGTTTYEIKIAKENLAAACEADSIEHISVLYYIPRTQTQVLWWHRNKGGSNADTASQQVGLILRDNGVQNYGWMMRYFYFTEQLPEAAETTTEATLDPNLFTTAAPLVTTTAKATVANTTAADSAAETTAAEKSGCGSSITIGALAILPILGSGVAVACTKKREND